MSVYDDYTSAQSIVERIKADWSDPMTSCALAIGYTKGYVYKMMYPSAVCLIDYSNELAHAHRGYFVHADVLGACTIDKREGVLVRQKRCVTIQSCFEDDYIRTHPAHKIEGIAHLPYYERCKIMDQAYNMGGDDLVYQTMRRWVKMRMYIEKRYSGTYIVPDLHTGNLGFIGTRLVSFDPVFDSRL